MCACGAATTENAALDCCVEKLRLWGWGLFLERFGELQEHVLTGVLVAESTNLEVAPPIFRFLYPLDVKRTWQTELQGTPIFRLRHGSERRPHACWGPIDPF